LKKRKVDNSIEKNILKALIISDVFCNDIIGIIKPEYFKIEYAQKIFIWIENYYNEYNKAPNSNIESIFEIEKDKLQDDISDIIELFLINISEDYESETFNSEYHIKKSKEYFQKRNLELFFEKGSKLMSAGRVQEAMELKLETLQDQDLLSDVFNPFDENVWKTHFARDEDNKLFCFDGALYDLFQDFQRGWLVAITATEKKGKTWMLEEFIFQALMAGVKVLWFSLEMNRVQLEKRFYAKLTGRPDKDINSILIPVFDCLNNQNATCKKRERENRNNKYMQKMSSDKHPNEFTLKGYKPCTACRGKNSDYKTAVWNLIQKDTKKMNTEIIGKKVAAFKQLFSDNLRIKIFPAFSASGDDIKRVINQIEETQGFEPGLIVTDYFDIQKREGISDQPRDAINKIWQDGKNIAAERNCVVITADQADAKARGKKSLDQTNFSDDKRKDSHLDCRIGLNQEPDEKERGIMRLNVLFHRHHDFNITNEVIVLQNLTLGQAILDSEHVYINPNSIKENKNEKISNTKRNFK